MAADYDGYRWQQLLNTSRSARIFRFLMKECSTSISYRAITALKYLYIQCIRFIQFAVFKSKVQAIAILCLRRAALLRNSFIKWGLLGWKLIIEAAIILIIVFMPILNSWGLLLPLLLLLWLCSEGHANPIAKEFIIFWLALIISACFSGGFRSGIQSLKNYSCWLLIAYLSGKGFSRQFSQRIIKYLVCSSLLWLSLGLMQQRAGVPTPLGWLGQEQRSVITIRSYSLFGNPNIFALYLLSMLVFTCYLIIDTLVWPKKARIKKTILTGDTLDPGRASLHPFKIRTRFVGFNRLAGLIHQLGTWVDCSIHKFYSSGNSSNIHQRFQYKRGIVNSSGAKIFKQASAACKCCQGAGCPRILTISFPSLRKGQGMVDPRSFLKMKILSLFLILSLILVALYFTYSRTAWLIGLTFLFVQFWPKLGKWRWATLLMVPLFLLTLQGFKIRMATVVTLTDSSLWYRVRIWQGVIKALPSFWLWGAGPGAFPVIYPWYQIKDTVSTHAHQIFLQLWLENGILSLASFIWLIKKMNLRFTKAHQLTQGIAMVIMIFLGYGLTETWFQNRLIGGYFWLFCGLWISSKGEGLVRE